MPADTPLVVVPALDYTSTDTCAGAVHNSLFTNHALPFVSPSPPRVISTECVSFALHRCVGFGSKLGRTRMAPPRVGLNFLRGGLPFIVLTVGGWLGISHFLSGKFELRVRPCTGIRHLIILSHLQLLEPVNAQALHSPPAPMSLHSRCPTIVIDSALLHHIVGAQASHLMAAEMPVSS